ncbi:alpha-(1,3)-fucosyltransferase 7 isoform X2 [Sphaeramia orbicularis]|uniref:Fucosyltransferase n=1 Tax=Sphaeramia orbicularis TaxID=375764 RepID=A0A672YJR7_9TELE|nr:alpha-(1,3)-fucosyltransferase 7-like isoform X2 [Sphaeramia orbicularis]
MFCQRRVYGQRRRLTLFPSFLDQIVPRNAPRVLQRNISILLWHWPFGVSYRLHGNKCLELYNISRCFLTNNASALSTADVVVFHHQELSNGLSTLPLHLGRPAWQRWVWLSMEPPVNNSNLTLFNGLFNWTMSYRRDADIYIPYGKTVPGGSRPKDLAPSNRSCLVSWVVTKYENQQVRTQVYQSLKNYIPIEVYGKWTKRPLLNKKLLPTIAKCLFYLAFENSVATDYISEKLWRNSFQAGVVPVVLGPSRATYEALAPPNSFIHVADFKTVADLAAHLKHLAADRKSYEAYLQWHRTHTVQTYTDWRERLCQICVQYPSLQTSKVYQDLAGWVNK